MRVGVIANQTEHFRYSWPSLANGMRAGGLELHFAASDAGKADGGIVVDSIHGITRRPSVKNLVARKSLEEWCRTRRIDRLLVNNATPAAIVRLASPLNLPITYFAHGLHWNQPSGLKTAHWRLIERVLLRRTSQAIVLNSDDEKWFKGHAAALPVLRLAYGVGVDLSEFPRTPIPSRAPEREMCCDLVWVGELSTRKRPALALEVIETLNRMGIPSNLRMLGDGPLRGDLDKLVQDRNLGSRVQLLGRKSPLKYYVESNALLHTAEWEGYPRVFLESAAVGREVFAFDVKGVRDQPNVRTASDGRPEELARTIAQWWSTTGKGDTASSFMRSSLDSHDAGMEIAQFLREEPQSQPFL